MIHSSWHENPARQWIVPLSGTWGVESVDDQRVEFGPGEISSGEDQHCLTEADDRTGHRSGTVGDEPVHLMIVQMHVPPIAAACHCG